MRELLSDIAEHWDDGYWWADRPMLTATVTALITGLLAVTFTALQAVVTRKLNPPVPR